MKSRLWHSFTLIGCLLFAACSSSKNEISIVSKNFEDVVEQQQNLVFTFNKELVPDSLTQRWDTAQYIEFTPAVKGMHRWTSTNELTFSPAAGFAPETEYTAVITKQVFRHSKKAYWLGNKTTVHFHTPPLTVNNAHISWTRGKSMANVMVQLDIDLNYEVKLEDALSKIKLSSGGNTINYTAVNNGTAKTVSVEFMPLNDSDVETPVKIEVAKGIPISGSKVVSAKDTVITENIPSRYNLTVTDVTAQHSGTEGTITVNTSQPIREEKLKEMIQLEPAVPFEVTTMDGGFIITSTSLKIDQAYMLNISTGMEGVFGGKMKSEFSQQVSFGKLKPSIDFNNTKGMYLSSQGYRNLALTIVNVPKVRVAVVKVYENNIEAFMRSSKNYDYDYENDEGGSYQYYSTGDIGDTVFTKTYETNKLPRLNAARLLHVDFEDKIKDYNGVYVIYVSSEEHRWVQQSKILSISDIGLIVKQENDNVYVFANSIKNATPIAGAKIAFISTNNQKLYTSTTNSEGLASFTDISKQSPGFRVGMITAKMDHEFNFVWLNGTKVETSRFDVGGRQPNETGLNAMIYAERNLYRPGETMHVSTVVRDETWEKPGELPVKLKLIMPNGKEFTTIKKILNEEGSCETSFNMPVTTPTGTYSLQVYTGNDVLLNSYNISVEEFVPDRIKASLKINKDKYVIGDTLKAYVQADNLFGTPAANRNYEFELSLHKGTLEHDKYPDYDFTVANEFVFENVLQKGQTNEKGAAYIPYVLDNKIADVGVVTGNVTATIFDETGRPVHRYEHFTLYTNKTFLGIKGFERYVSTRTPMKISLIAVNKEGVAQNNVEANVTVVKTEWRTVIQQDGNGYKYVSQKDEKVLSQKTVKINATNTAFYYTPQLSGDYEVRVSFPGSESYVSRRFYSWGWDDTQYTSFEVNNEGNVDITADKKKYGNNDDINLLFTAPFEGRMLVTLERDHMIKYYYLNTKNKSASLRVRADDGFVPNIYVNATLFRPMDGSDMPLTVAHGCKSITVENTARHIPVKVSVAAKSRSKTKQTITVKTIPGAYVTVAAVDEGILQVKDFVTPDPYAYFYQKVALSVSSYDIYPLLLPELKTVRTSTGGDGADESAMRFNPNFVNRTKLVSYWSGILQADGNGIATYSIDIPQFSGDLRVMAYSYKGKSFGAIDQHMKVSDPIVISAALPRFLSPKDEVVMPVTISNTTAKDANAAVSVQVSGPLNIVSTSTQAVKIAANREGRVVFNVRALPSVGAGKVTVTVKSLNEVFTNETEISIRPPASLQKITGSGTVNEGAIANIALQNNFVSETYRGKLIVSKSPLVQFSDNLTYLIQYPYGCVEQTTSAAFPQLYYQDLVRTITGRETSDMNPGYNVRQAITKLQSMQLPNGALSYWPGGGSESWWGSVFATHFLLEARKAGFEVNAHTIDRLLEYQKFKLAKRETETYYYNGSQKREIASQEIAYSLYVLALAGQPQQATMNYYKSRLELLSPDSKYLLAAAYAISGQQQQAKQVLPLAFPNEKANRSFSGSFYSYIRDEALSLNALLDMDPNNPQVGILARQLSEQVKQEHYMNTQEDVFTVLAFGKIARASNKNNAAAIVLTNGKTLGSGNQDMNIDLRPYPNKQLQVQVKGKGNFYYFWQISGITADGSYKEEDSYMKVRRYYYDRTGREITNNNFHQNDLIVVRISIAGQYSHVIDNVVITDMLPAGFEIENSRLNEMPEMKWIKNETEADYQDIRDDRINFFTSVSGSEKNFYYMVRAVSPGTYQLGPVQADAMYDGSYHSYHGAGIVKVNER